MRGTQRGYYARLPFDDAYEAGEENSDDSFLGVFVPSR